MTPNEYQNRIQRAKQLLIENRPAEVLTIAQELIDQVIERIQTGGRNSEGQQFAPYNPIYAQRGRRAQGYQAEYVDFTRRGRMWASVQPFIERNDTDTTQVEIRARDAENQRKIDGQAKKRGNILRPSDQEIQIARDANNARILNFLNENL